MLIVIIIQISFANKNKQSLQKTSQQAHEPSY